PEGVHFAGVLGNQARLLNKALQGSRRREGEEAGAGSIEGLRWKSRFEGANVCRRFAVLWTCPGSDDHGSASSGDPPRLAEGTHRINGVLEGIESGDQVELLSRVRECFHFPDAKIRGGQSAPGDLDKPGCGINSGNRCPTRRRKMGEETSTAPSVEQ